MGTTHIAVSFVSSLNKLGISSIYTVTRQTDRLDSIIKYHSGIKERDGIYSDKCFYGIPAYGDGIMDPVEEDMLRIKDCGCLMAGDLLQCREADLFLVVLSGSDWDMTDMLYFSTQVKAIENLVFICNYGNQKAAKKLAKLLKTPVYCFPCDKDPFHPTTEKERLVSAIFRRKGGKTYFRL